MARLLLGSLRRSFSSLASTPDLDPRLLASSLRCWFRPTPPSDLDSIFRALSSPDPSSALSSLRLRIDDSLLVRVLRHSPRSPHPSLLPLKLHFFDWASRHPLYRPSPSAYRALFLLFSRHRLSRLVLDWLHRHSSSSPSRRPPGFHSILVLGFAAARRPDAALRALTRMRFIGLDLDAHGYHALLGALVDCRRFAAAEAIARQMAERGLAGPTTAAIHIRALCRQGRPDDARAALQDAAGTWGVPAMDNAAAYLANHLGKRQRFKDAGAIVEAYGGPVTESIWVHSLVTSRKADGAMEFLRRRRTEGHVPQIVNYNRVLYLLLRQGRLVEVFDFLSEMNCSGIIPDHETMNVVLCFLCKGGMVDVALPLFECRGEFGLVLSNVAFTNFIDALCVQGSLKEACLVLEQGLEQGYFPRKKTFQILKDVLLSEGMFDKLPQYLEIVMQKQLPVGPATDRYGYAMPDAGWKEGDLAVAVERTSIVRVRNMYVGLIRGFIWLRRGDMVCRLLMEMQDRGLVPFQKLYRECICFLCKIGRLDLVSNLFRMQRLRNVLTPKQCYNYFIDGLGHAKRPDMAMEVFKTMTRDGIKPDLNSKILMLQSFIKSDLVGNTLKFFDEIHVERDPSIRMHNILITGLCRVSRPVSAMMKWDEVRRKGVIPSLQCYEDLIAVLGSIKDYTGIVKVVKDFEKTGRPLSSFICNVLLMHSLKTEALKEAWFSYEDDMTDNDSEKSQNTNATLDLSLLGRLIVAFSGGIRTRHLNSLDEELEKHVPVNLYTYNILLKGMTMARKMDHALNLFHKMCEKGYIPNKWTYDTIIRGFCEIGRKKEASEWMEKMYRCGFFPTSGTIDLFHRTSQRPDCLR